jgi:hypothetical protein
MALSAPRRNLEATLIQLRHGGVWWRGGVARQPPNPRAAGRRGHGSQSC